MTGSDARWGLAAAGWSVYALYYLGRVNFSAAVPGLESEMGFTPSQIGVMAAGFFWTYSLSVAPIGKLADRMGTRWLVGLGLAGSGLANVWFAFSASFAPAFAAWSVNGVFQAMGWTPLLGALRRWVPPERADRVIASFGSCFVAGTALALALGGLIAERAGARMAFLAAAAVLIPLGALWWATVRDPVSPPPPTAGGGTWRGVRRAAPLLLPAAAIGAAFVALVVWTPAYFAAAHGLSESRAGFLSALLPVAALIVIALAGRWFRRGEGPRLALRGGALAAAAAAALAAVAGASGLGAGFLAMAAATALVGAASSVALGLFPRLLDADQAAFTGGIFVLAFNLGGGAAAPVIGGLAGRGSWSSAFLFLAACAAAGALWTGGWYVRAIRKGGSDNAGG